LFSWAKPLVLSRFFAEDGALIGFSFFPPQKKKGDSGRISLRFQFFKNKIEIKGYPQGKRKDYELDYDGPGNGSLFSPSTRG
jgi:hypothetical protein